MCIAILNNGSKIKKETLKNCWNNNPDGGSFAYFGEKDKKPFVYKSLKSFDALHENYEKHKTENENTPFLLHFRIGTSGKVNLSNCHPFYTSNKKDQLLIHNGILDYRATKNKSDTNCLTHDLRKNNFNIKYESHKKELEKICGKSSKFVILNSDKFYIINESAGNWKGKNWFSNYSYESFSNYYFTPDSSFDSFDSFDFDSYDVKKKNICICGGILRQRDFYCQKCFLTKEEIKEEKEYWNQWNQDNTLTGIDY